MSDELNRDGEKISPQPATFWNMATVLMATIVIVQIVIAVAAYPFLPDRVPSHWNIAGQINGYMPKLIGLGLYPLISFVLFVVLRGIVKLGPRLTHDGERNNAQFIDITLVGVMLLMLIVQLTTIAIALGMRLDLPFIICLVISLFFIVLGNYMGKLRRNFWAGIRTPWTLTNDTVWERTHRFGGWLFVASGLIGLVCSFLPSVRLLGIVVPLCIVAIGSYVYSYIVYQRVAGRGPGSNEAFGEGHRV